MKLRFAIVLVLPWLASCDCGGTTRSVAHAGAWGDMVSSQANRLTKDNKFNHEECWNFCLGVLGLADTDYNVTSCGNFEIVGYLSDDGTLVPEWTGGMGGGGVDAEGNRLLKTGMPWWEFDCHLEFSEPCSVVPRLNPSRPNP